MPPREDGSVLVGDIAYSTEEWESLLAKNLDSLKKLWPKTNGVVNIPYKISNPEVSTAKLKGAFSAWESKTCVKFSKMAKSDKYMEYLDFVITGTTCSSNIGYTKGKITSVNLPSSCSFKAFKHELGHSMGLRHEMNRSDRDKHIIVISGVKYKPGFDSQFALMNTINFDIPYDYCSIMHYTDKVGSENYEHTMLALDARFQTLMGWCSTNITHWNYKLVNTMYNCTDDWLKACKQESDPCKNGGYTRKDCSCACPLGTSGDKCENLDMNYNDAMAKKLSYYTAIIKTSGAKVTSPDYPKPSGMG
ncbi:protein SpAN, partial [Hyalella azteca]|uniref:Metalloendopeptidase n=1 Tax=Hyalella azteca TaxID=294128 RepID=A0A8B7NXF4_HYAAZ